MSPRSPAALSRRAALGLGAGALLGAALHGGARAAGAPRRRLLVFHQRGGWDTTYVFDPKFGGPVQTDPGLRPGRVGDLRFGDADARPSVRAFFDAHGARCCIVNGIGVSSISHPQCTRLLFTGSLDPTLPDLPARVAAGLGAHLPLPHAVLSGPRFPGPHGALVTAVVPRFADTLGCRAPEDRPCDLDQERLIAQFLAEEARAGAAAGRPAAAAIADALDRQAALAADPTALELPDHPTVEDRLRLALELLARGTSLCATVEGDTPPLQGWDSHNDNHAKQTACHERTFGQLHGLVDALASTRDADGAPLIETTTLLVVSEMGRTPVLNATLGKDHWPWTSALLLGAGVQGGQVVGGTDEGLVGIGTDPDTGAADPGAPPLDATALLAGLLESFGLDPAASFPGTPPLRAPFTG